MNRGCKRVQELLGIEGLAALKHDDAAEQHLLHCADCLQVLESIAALDQALAELPRRDVNDDVVAQLLQRPELQEQKWTARLSQRAPSKVSVWRRHFATTGAAIDWVRATRLRMGIAAVPVALFAVTFLVFHFTDIGQGYRYATLASEKKVYVVRQPKIQQPKDLPAIHKPKTKRIPIPDPTPDEPMIEFAPDDSLVLAVPAPPLPAPAGSEPGDVLWDRDWSGNDRFNAPGQDAGRVEQDRRQKPVSNEFGDDIVSGMITQDGVAEEVTVTASMPVIDTSTMSSENQRLAEIRSRALSAKEQNRLAEREAKEFRRKLALVEEQARELDKLGEVEEAEMLRRQLEELGKKTERGLRSDRDKNGELRTGRGGSIGLESDGSTARAFLAEREDIDDLVFLEPRGYWANTYVPGDRELRRLEARLASRDRASLEGLVGGELQLHDAAIQPPQPYDAPNGSAMAVYLRSDRRGLDARQRLLLEVGLKGTSRRSGSRPAMNVGVVLDLRGTVSEETAACMRALVEALAAAHDLGDRFSLTVAGRDGGMVVPAERFRHGPLMVAMCDLLEAEPAGEGGLSLGAALTRAIETVAAEDDSSTPLGSSVVLLVTAQALGSEIHELLPMAHASAVAGVPVSVVGVGSGLSLSEVDRLVLAGQGNRRLLAQADEAEAVIERELSAVSRVIARALRLRIRLAPGVQLVDVIASVRLDEHKAQRVRDAENAIDQRLSRNLGITADRGLDEEGIQIVIPSFYAEDEHVILLDLVAPGPGPVADVSLRYKDLVWLKNGVCSAHLSLGRDPGVQGPLQINVIKNLLGRRLGQSLESAGAALAEGNHSEAVHRLESFRTLLLELPAQVVGLQGDRDLEDHVDLLDEYLSLLRAGVENQPENREHLVDSLRFAGRLQLLSRPITWR